MPRGNPNIGKMSQISGTNVTTTDEENANYIDLIQESFNYPRPDLTKPDEIDQAIQAYFMRCKKHGTRPGNMGLYNALGITRQDVNNYIAGRLKAPNPAFLDTLKKAKSIMAEYREILGSQNKIAAPTLIFWQKNHDNFQDVQTIEIDANAAPKAEKTPEEIAAMIESDIPIDAEYTEKPL